MNWNAIEILAGSMSSIIFASGTLAMLVKAWKTRDFGSYSFSSLMLNNVGNTVYWLYVLSLPVGPIHLLHSFYTAATLIMFAGYMLSEPHRSEKRSEQQSPSR